MIVQIITVALILLGVGLDQLTKYLVVTNMELYESIDVIPGVFRFTYVQNKGAAFGSFDDQRWVFMLLSSVMIIGILVYIFLKKPREKLMLSALILVVSGGIGNMVDRIFLGYVVDFIDFCAFPQIWRWVFNVADTFVCVGVGILILWLILDTVRTMKLEKAKKECSESSEEDENGD